nr:hypothetical protein [Tanacetum cinerariifolium]
MALTFADTHNMIAHPTKSDASEGFEQILDFLNASVINYALIVNPTIYVSCIKQFWSSVSIKKVNDVIRLQALIDRKKVIIIKDTVREALNLDDAESIDCLPNEEIFTELARMDYEKPSTKLTFYKAFLSAQWKFLIHIILQCMSAKRTTWNEFSSSMASAVICLATCSKFNFSKYIFDSLVRNVDSSSKFYMYLRFLRLMIAAQVGDFTSHTTKYTSPALTQKVFANMRRVGKRFSRVNTPLFKRMLVLQQATVDVDDVVAASVPADDVADVVTDDVADVAPTPPLSPHQSPQQQPSSPPQQPQPLQTTKIFMDLLNNPLEPCTALTRRVENLEQDKIAQALKITKLKQREDASKHGGIIELIDVDEDLILEEFDAKKDAKVAEENKDVQGRKEESQAQAYHIDLEHVDKVLSMHDDEPEPARVKEVIEVVTIAKLMTKVVTAATTTTISVAPITAATTIIAASSAVRRRKEVEELKPLKKEGKEEWKERQCCVLRYQALKRKLQTEAQSRKNIMVYLKNMAGFKMDFFKGMSYDDIHPIFEKYFNSNVAFLKKSKEELGEEASRALKRKSESSKEKVVKKQKYDEEVHVVDYEIHTENNKPYYKIIRADGTHQLFLSCLSLLRNFDRDKLEMLWKIVQDNIASSKPNNFSDDFLLTALKSMFEKPDVEDQGRIVGLYNLLISYMLMLFSFGVNATEDFNENTLRDYYCWLKTYRCWYKLMLLVNAVDSRVRLLEQSAVIDDKMKK